SSRSPWPIGRGLRRVRDRQLPAVYRSALPKTPIARLRRTRVDATDREGRAATGDLDRGQGVDDPEARKGRGGCRQAGRPGDALPGALLRALLLPGPGSPVLRVHR